MEILSHRIVTIIAVFVGMSIAAIPGIRSETGDTPGQTSESLGGVLDTALSRVVKITGAGGYRGLEPYQTGILISSQGHVLTAWSHVLQSESVTVTLADGRREQAELIAANLAFEAAILKLPRPTAAWFELGESDEVLPVTRVFALSNAFAVAVGNEPVSVQRGFVSAVTQIEGGRGILDLMYRGRAYILDFVSGNPGAAGGALVDSSGRLIGMLGKPLQNRLNGAWINYAIPTTVLRPWVQQVLAGKGKPVETDDRLKPSTASRAWSLEQLGIILVPEIAPETPAYVDRLPANSPARMAGLMPDDLIVLINGRVVRSVREVREFLTECPSTVSVVLGVDRGGELVEITIEPAMVSSL